MLTLEDRNVNGAYRAAVGLATQIPDMWRTVSPRGQTTIEMKQPVATTYRNPTERVLFDPVRDANPFFHFFEALWILAGRNDVAFLKQFNSNITNYSDDGKTFHAPYGQRIRGYMSDNPENSDGYIDQLSAVISMLRADHDTRQAVLTIWDPDLDLGRKSRDIPCNDMIFLKIRDEKLEMRVCCRSNDVIWGAYGANVVQFSTLQEFIAGAVGVGVGPYTQISDSFHIYTEREDWARIKDSVAVPDPYVEDISGSDAEDGYAQVYPYRMWDGVSHSALFWLTELALFMKYAMPGEHLPMTFQFQVPYLQDVALPMLRAWRCWKSEFGNKNVRIANAAHVLDRECLASDWTLAGKLWLKRRQGV